MKIMRYRRGEYYLEIIPPNVELRYRGGKYYLGITPGVESGTKAYREAKKFIQTFSECALNPGNCPPAGQDKLSPEQQKEAEETITLLESFETEKDPAISYMP